MMPTTLMLLRAEWRRAIALWERLENDETLMRAVNAERKYVFSWRRWRHLSCHGRAKQCVKHKDPAVGWTVLKM